MKCPKCDYLGFEELERCRNCGYEFSLVEAPAVPDLSIRTGHTGEGLRPVELPLFNTAVPDDEPLITRPSPPRQPLSVRRANLEGPRVRSVAPRPGILDLHADADPEPLPSLASTSPVSRADTPRDRAPSEAAGGDAPLAARFVAVTIDLLLLAAIDLAVVYLTMQVCGIGPDEIPLLPVLPLAAFFCVLNGGYLVAFTLGGQTLGKMAVGIRVVPAASRASLDVGSAFAREALWVLLAVPAGLGFLSVLGSGHRGLHDRLAGTRVVR
jgi:uncharacterized RDD family membrane protein YckC